MNLFKVCIIFLSLFSLSYSQSISIKGKIVDNTTRLPIAGAKVLLFKNKVSVKADKDGKFDFSKTISISNGIQSHAAIAPAPVFQKDGTMSFTLKSNTLVSIRTFSLKGETLSDIRKKFTAGSHKILLQITVSGIYLHQIDIGGKVHLIKQVKYSDLFSAGNTSSNGYNFLSISENTFSKTLYASFPETQAL